MPEFDIVSPTRRREIRDIGRGYFFKESNGRVHTVNCEWTRGYSWAGRVFLRDETDARDFLKGKSWRNCSVCGGVTIATEDFDSEVIKAGVDPGMAGRDGVLSTPQERSLSVLQKGILDEIRICAEHQAYRAAIVLSATLLENILREELENRSIKGTQQGGDLPTLGARISSSKDFLKGRALKAARRINELRNLIVHANEPEEEQIEKEDADEVWACLQRFLRNPFKEP